MSRKVTSECFMLTTVITILTSLICPTTAPAQLLPELPRSYVDTTYVPATGRTLTVPAGGDFRGALNMAQPGDVIMLEAGATFTGQFTLPNKSGSGWIVVRTSAPDSSLPPPGTRITPAYASVMAKITITNDPGPALVTAAGAHHFRFIGIEFTTEGILYGGSPLSYGIVYLGGPPYAISLDQVPHHIIFDRCYIHGTPTMEISRGILMNSASTAIIDSYFSELHGRGQEAQTFDCFNGPGPFKIVNNYLEAAGENLIFGGADSSIPNLVPSDIEIRGNHFFKPLSWKKTDPSYAGIPWVVKNLLELKNAQRVLIQGNVFEHNWTMAQDGNAILFTPRNQNGTAPWSVVRDVTFQYNIVRKTAQGFNILGADYIHPSQQTQRIAIRHNLIGGYNSAETIGHPQWDTPNGKLFNISSGVADLVIEHNTLFIWSGADIAAAGVPSLGFVFRDNLAAHGAYGITGDNHGPGSDSINIYFPNAVVTNNVFATGAAVTFSRSYPPGNFFHDTWVPVQFVNLDGGDYRLAALSPYHNAGTDGKDIGADIAALRAMITGAPNPPTNLRVLPPR